MSQSKKHSAIEASTNVIVGLLASFFIQLGMYRVLQIEVSINQNITIALVFFVTSFIRGYTIRRLFNTRTKKQELKRINYNNRLN